MAFAIPFILAVIGAGLVSLIQSIAGLAGKLESGSGLSAVEGKLIRYSLVLALAAGAGFYIFSQPLVRSAARVVAKSSEYQAEYGDYSNYSDWGRAASELTALMDKHPVVLTSTGVKAAYYLGGFSFDLNSSVMLENGDGSEFVLDERTGRRVISSPESVAAVLFTCAPALVIVESRHAGSSIVPPATIALLDRFGTEVKFSGNLRVWTIPAFADQSNDVSPLQGLANREIECLPVERSQKMAAVVFNREN